MQTRRQGSSRSPWALASFRARIFWSCLRALSSSRNASVLPWRFRWLNLPIPDQQAPDNAWTEHWETIRTDIKNGLDRGEKFLIHCKGGFGRTGTIAAMILMDHGYGWQEAITECRKSRELAVETRVQEEYLLSLIHI